jgi:molybdopterin-guanine dinucleotide biosynthesis protein A
VEEAARAQGRQPAGGHREAELMTITGIVLAGGRSTRMGQDKASLPIGGETMVERVVRVAGSVADELIVVTRLTQAGSDPMRAVGRDPRVRFVHDPVEELGPLAGIAAGLAATHSDVNLVIACDMPLIRPAVLRRLIELQGDADICVAVAGGHASPLCAAYRGSVGVTARELLQSGERRVMALLDRVNTKRVDAAAFRDIDPDLESFFSCDTPEAYAALLARETAL